eukprot:15456775-Alexandrium_andersonii.AAC.1
MNPYIPPLAPRARSSRRACWPGPTCRGVGARRSAGRGASAPERRAGVSRRSDQRARLTDGPTKQVVNT